MAGTVEERRAIIATLVRRGDADAVALLRWALGASDPDLAVDAALALEEMTASFDARLAACREALAAAQGRRRNGRDRRPPCRRRRPRSRPPSSSPTRSTSASPIPRWCRRSPSEARDDYALAAADSRRRRTRSRSDARSSSSARCAPTPRSPASTRRCPAAGPEIRPVLLSLREEALLASHALPWEGPSALASYQVRAWSHARRPPPLTARRRLGNLPPPPLSASIRGRPGPDPGRGGDEKGAPCRPRMTTALASVRSRRRSRGRRPGRRLPAGRGDVSVRLGRRLVLGSRRHLRAPGADVRRALRRLVSRRARRAAVQASARTWSGCTACSVRTRRSRRSTAPGAPTLREQIHSLRVAMDARPAKSRVLAGLERMHVEGEAGTDVLAALACQRPDAARAAARPLQLPAADDDRRAGRARCAVPRSVLALPRDLRARACACWPRRRWWRAATTPSRPAMRGCWPRCGATAPAGR